MPKLWRLLGFLTALGWVGSLASQEPALGPIPIGGGQTTTQQNGQILQMSATGITADIYFNEISTTRVTGSAVRTSPGTTSGTVTITWVNRGRTTTLSLSITNPDDPFSMEGGEGDKRTNPTRD